MNDFKQRLAEELVKEFPKLDIRTDQCDVVRIYAGHLLIAVSQEQAGYIAKVIPVDGELDFDTKVEKVLAGGTVDEIIEKVGAVLGVN
jgi:hypothetical protein